MVTTNNKKSASDGDSHSLSCLLDPQSRHEFKKYFENIQLSEHRKKTLESLLLSQSRPSYFLNFFQFNKKVILSHFVTAAATIVITLGLAHYSNFTNEQSVHDVISEVATLSENLNFPADFNLDGNLNDLPDLINDSLPNHSFHPVIPSQIAQNFSAFEGRFFLYKGEQGVGISVQPSVGHLGEKIPLRLQEGFETKQPSTLYIVKLSEKNRSYFPSHKVSRKISSPSGKLKRVYAWQDGTYGYAMVQPMGLEE